MIGVPFNRWTLKFIDSKWEQQFEDQQNDKRLLCFRVCTVCLAIVTLVHLFSFLIQQQPPIVMIVLGAMTAGNLSLFIMSSKLKKYLKHAYSLLYAWVVFTGLLITYSGIYIPLYVYGFYTSVFLNVLLNFSDNRLKFVYIIASPLIISGVFQQLNSTDFPWSILAILSSTCGGLLAYINEYTSRLSFSQYISLQKQLDIIKQYTEGQLFGISLNQRTQQFQLEFQNTLFQKTQLSLLKISDFLRQYFVIVNNQSSKKSLEDYLFEIIHNIQSPSFQEIDCIQNSKQSTQQKINFKIQIQDQCNKIIVIQFQNNNSTLLEKQSEINKQNLITASKGFQQIIHALLILQKEILRVRTHLDCEDTQLLTCLNLWIITQVRNNLFFNLKNKLSILSNHEQFCESKFSDYLKIMQFYCSTFSNKQRKRFELINYTNSNLIIKTNLPFLTQITTNFFTPIIYKCENKVLLEISVQNNINPFNNGDNEYPNYNPHLQLLRFSYYFNTKGSFDIESSKIQVINQQLLKIIGPYNCYKHLEVLQDELSLSFLNEITFYIYTDLSQLDDSFMNKHDL